MVRHNGRRCGCKEAVLAQVFDTKSDAEGMWFELPVFDPDTFAPGWVRFRETLVVPLRILDLTVFDRHGDAEIRFEEPAPRGVMPSWARRYDVLATEFRSVYERYSLVSDGLNGNQREEALRHVQQSVTGGNSVIGGAIDLEKKGVRYNLRRIRRLKEPLASALLRAYSAYLARDAFDHDFTRAMHEDEEDEVVETTCDVAQ
jgi:hypothetical protein